jgi:PleD family two-component response regulator
VATRDTMVGDVEELVELADAAQSRAKSEGRDRVVVWRREAFARPAVVR